MQCKINRKSKYSVQISRHSKYCDPTQCRVSSWQWRQDLLLMVQICKPPSTQVRPVADLLYTEKVHLNVSPNFSYASWTFKKYLKVKSCNGRIIIKKCTNIPIVFSAPSLYNCTFPRREFCWIFHNFNAIPYSSGWLVEHPLNENAQTCNSIFHSNRVVHTCNSIFLYALPAMAFLQHFFLGIVVIFLSITICRRAVSLLKIQR